MLSLWAFERSATDRGALRAARMFTGSTPTAATELASPAMLSPCHGVSGRNDVIYPPEFEEGAFCEVRNNGVLRSSPGPPCEYPAHMETRKRYAIWGMRRVSEAC